MAGNQSNCGAQIARAASDGIGAGTAVVGVSRAEIGPHGFFHRGGHLRTQDLSRDLWRSAIRLEEADTIRAMAQVPPKIGLIVFGQIALDVVEAEIDELLTVDHAVALRPYKQSFDGQFVSRLRDITRQIAFAKGQLAREDTDLDERVLSRCSRCQILTSLNPPEDATLR
jgi:hypothetical protein